MFYYRRWSNKRPGVQERAFNRLEAFILVTYFNGLNITVYSILSAKKRFCVNRISTAGLTAYLEIEHDVIHKMMLIKQ